MNIFTRLRLETLERSLGVSFDDRSLLELAFVHSSFIAEYPDVYPESNERLEFLGDALIDLVVAAELYTRFPDSPEGQLTQMRAALVSKEALALVADALKLGGYLILGKGETETGGVERESNRANAFEALVGAIFLDQGYVPACEFTLRVMEKAITVVINGDAPLKHPKSLLHEVSMSRGFGPPVYKVIDESGDDHKREFTVEAVVNGRSVGKGIGSRKSLAEREAAREALRAMDEIA
jgi:ribonuclease-3